jgi:hypothetical protein
MQLQKCIADFPSLVMLFRTPPSSSTDYHTRLEVELNRLRKACANYVDNLSQSSAPSDATTGAVCKALDSVASVAEKLTGAHSETIRPTLLGAALEALFCIARVKVASDPLGAFADLERCPPLVRACMAKDFPNSMRCTAAAFYNCGVKLYKGGDHSTATRFFHKACEFGAEALASYDTQPEARDESGFWAALREQMPKRWELLAYCYGRSGDKRVCLIASRCQRSTTHYRRW